MYCKGFRQIRTSRGWHQNLGLDGVFDDWRRRGLLGRAAMLTPGTTDTWGIHTECCAASEIEAGIRSGTWMGATRLGTGRCMSCIGKSADNQFKVGALTKLASSLFPGG
jgi:hypothetical protein